MVIYYGDVDQVTVAKKGSLYSRQHGASTTEVKLHQTLMGLKRQKPREADGFSSKKTQSFLGQ
jgi:hypothetical protein